MTHRIMFLPYSPRAGAVEEGYEEWLREIDNPFFNSRPAVKHYTNWAVSDAVAGDVWFSHFDILVYEGEADALWNDPPLAKFAADWVKRWGMDPDNEDVAVNYHAYAAQGDDGWHSLSGQVTIAYDAAPSSGPNWAFTKGVVGEPAAKTLTAVFQSVGAAPALSAPLVAVGTLVAGP